MFTAESARRELVSIRVLHCQKYFKVIYVKSIVMAVVSVTVSRCHSPSLP